MSDFAMLQMHETLHGEAPPELTELTRVLADVVGDDVVAELEAALVAVVDDV